MSYHIFRWPLALIVLANISILHQHVLIARCHATTTYAANNNNNHNNNNGFEHPGATDGRKAINNDEHLTINVDQVESMLQQQQQQHNNVDQQHGNGAVHTHDHHSMTHSISGESDSHQPQATGMASDQAPVVNPYAEMKSDLIEATDFGSSTNNNGHPTTESAVLAMSGHSVVEDREQQQPQQNTSRSNAYRAPVLSSLGGPISGSEPPDDDRTPSRPRPQEPYQINTESPAGGPVVLKQPQSPPQQPSHEGNMRIQVTPASRPPQLSKPVFNSTDLAQAASQQQKQSVGKQSQMQSDGQQQQQKMLTYVQVANQLQHPPAQMSSFAQNNNNNNNNNRQQFQQQPQQIPPLPQVMAPVAATNYNPMPPLYLGHNPFIEILKPHSYADDNIMTLNLSHSHIYEIDSDAFVGQRFEHIDLSNNKLGLIYDRSFRIGPIHSRHNPYDPHANHSTNKAMQANGQVNAYGPTRRPPPTHPKSVTIDFSHNPFIIALSGAFDHIDVPNCLLNFTNSKVELRFGAFKKYFKEHPGHIIDVESVDCCEQEWLLGYRHNFVQRTHCEHDPNLILSKVSQQVILESCAAYVKHNMNIQYGPSMIHQWAAASGHQRNHNQQHIDNNYLTYVILGGTAMVLASLSIYILVYMCSLKAALVYRMQTKS